jgi:hypothetical protein
VLVLHLTRPSLGDRHQRLRRHVDAGQIQLLLPEVVHLVVRRPQGRQVDPLPFSPELQLGQQHSGEQEELLVIGVAVVEHLTEELIDADVAGEVALEE